MATDNRDKNKKNRQNGKKDGNPFEGYRSQMLRTLVSLLAGEAGVTAASLLPPETEKEFVKLLGGTDGKLAEREIRMPSHLPELFIGDKLTDRAAREFASAFMQHMKEHGDKPVEQQEFLLRRLIGSTLKEPEQTKGAPTPLPLAKRQLIEEVAMWDPNERKRFIRFLRLLQDKRVMYQVSGGGAKVSVHGYVVNASQTRYVNGAWLRMAQSAIEIGETRMAVLYLRYAIDLGEPIPVPKPPAPKERTLGDDIGDLAKELLKNVSENAKEAFKAPDPNADLSPVSLWARSKTAEYRKLLGKTP